MDHNFQPLGTTQDKVAHLLVLVFFPLVSWSACLHLLDWHDGLGKSGIIPCVLIGSITALIVINMVRGLMSFSLHAALSDEGIQIKSGDQIQTYSFSDTQTVFKKDFGGLQIAKSGCKRLHPACKQVGGSTAQGSLIHQLVQSGRSSLSLWESSSPSLSLRWLSLFSNWKDSYYGGVLGATLLATDTRTN